MRAFSIVFGLISEDSTTATGIASVDVADQAKEIDSSYIIAVRLLHRRWFDGTKSSDESEGDSSIFPSIDWKLFDSLHKTRVTSEQYDLAITAMCEKMNASLLMLSKNTEGRQYQQSEQWVRHYQGCL